MLRVEDQRRMPVSKLCTPSIASLEQRISALVTSLLGMPVEAVAFQQAEASDSENLSHWFAVEGGGELGIQLQQILGGASFFQKRIGLGRIMRALEESVCNMKLHEKAAGTEELCRWRMALWHQGRPLPYEILVAAPFGGLSESLESSPLFNQPFRFLAQCNASLSELVRTNVQIELLTLMLLQLDLGKCLRVRPEWHENRVTLSVEEMTMDYNEALAVPCSIDMGTVEIPFEQALQLRPGSVIEFPWQGRFEGVLRIGIAGWARVEIFPREGEVRMEVKELINLAPG